MQVFRKCAIFGIQEVELLDRTEVRITMTKPTMTHVASGESHAVGAELHVLVMPSCDGGYFAQGLEIDYTATGATEAEARDRFARGFTATIQSYLRLGRDLGALFSKARTPPEYVQAYYASARRHVLHCMVIAVDVPDDTQRPAAIPRQFSFCSAERPQAIALLS
jgi:hypothetical protein